MFVARRAKTLAGFLFLVFFLPACIFQSSPPQPTAGPTQAALTATLTDISGKVEAKQPTDPGFGAATKGSTLQAGGQLRTGDDGRARLDLSDRTILRVGPSSIFALKSIDKGTNGANTSVTFDQGKLWIILQTGQMDVQTPSGVASVRGSYMSVNSRQDGSIRINCLEGNCSLKNSGGSVNLVAGQAADAANTNQAPQPGQMTPAEINEWLAVNPEAQSILPAVTATQQAIGPAATPRPQPTATPQPAATPVTLGPNAEDFPAGYNPLTGQPALDPSALKIPALLISISNFPPVVRPQAGLSFAPYVFEIYITEGATRFLTTFYGGFPAVETPFTGGCDVNKQPFVKTDTVLGNRVWLDLNANGVQDANEPGLGGVCVNLYDASGALVQQTTTDSNGYYGFNVHQPGHYTVEFIQPAGMKFTQKNVGDETHDSDADPATGRAEADVTSDVLSLDAGLVPPVDVTPTPDPTNKPVPPQVGPVRSGRLVYADIADFFQSSCLVYAFASEEVLNKIPQCAMVAHDQTSGGAMLDITRMQEIADKNEKADTKFNYASNKYTDAPPAGGSPASQLNVFFAELNQSGWTYDPLMQSYLRYTDNADKKSPGILHADTDRLTGRHLHFENVIVLYAQHDVISPTNLDIHLGQGETGQAILFRDGLEYPIQWSTKSGEYEQQTGLRRPVQWVDQNGNPFPLKPGHTWVIVVTPYTTVTDQGGGVWKMRFFAPAGAQ